MIIDEAKNDARRQAPDAPDAPEVAFSTATDTGALRNEGSFVWANGYPGQSSPATRGGPWVRAPLKICDVNIRLCRDALYNLARCFGSVHAFPGLACKTHASDLTTKSVCKSF
jgi:hypothetical protein